MTLLSHMQKTKRLFVAINLPMELKRELFEIQKEINGQFGEDYRNAGVFKWVAMENLHLTLKFIGQVGDSQIPKIVVDTEKMAKSQKPFEIKTERICYDTETSQKRTDLPRARGSVLGGGRVLGSGEMLPRLIWLTTNKGHITLARVKQWVFKKIEPEERPSINQDFEATIPVKSIELMESVLKRTGPEYKIIKSFNLKT